MDTMKRLLFDSLVDHGPAAWLDGRIFASAGKSVQSVIVGGDWLVREG
jgi:hypothetical protein